MCLALHTERSLGLHVKCYCTYGGANDNIVESAVLHAAAALNTVT